MQIRDITTEDIAQFPDRKGEIFRDKIAGAVEGFGKAQAEHNEQMARSGQMLRNLKRNGATNAAKFKSPTFMAGYVDGVRALEALYFSLDDSGGTGTPGIEEFAKAFARKHMGEIVSAYNQDIKAVQDAMDEIRSWDHHGLARYLLDGWAYYLHALNSELYAFAQLSRKA